MLDNVSALESALKTLEQAAVLSKIDPNVLTMLREPQREYITTFPIYLDDGTVQFFKGFRVQHNHALGPTGGGTRFHPEETYEDVKALALWMSIKNALNGIPAGGGKGGVICDPKLLSRREKERVCRGYIRAIAPMIGSGVDFPGADVGTNAEMMSWMLDEWEQMQGLRHEPAAISGKVIALGGSEGRPQATGLGVCLAVREACKVLGINIKGAKFAIQGFGKVGSWAARLLQNEGAKLIAVSDYLGGIYQPNGIDAFELTSFAHNQGSIIGYPHAQQLATSEEVLFIDCDILVPAAVQSTITADNCDRISARLISEGANGPITPKAEEELLNKGVFIIPDILANGGGTCIAHLEKVQGLYDDYWSEDKIVRRYEKMFVEKFKQVYETSNQEGLTMRMAAWVIALRTLEEGIKARGWV